MIPKKIHYIWLGNGKLNNTSLICINSWKRHLPDYEIVCWDEKSLNLEKLMAENKFLRQCYHYKLWAFMSDYLRLYVLYNYGGIYLDTDVEVVKCFDPLLKYPCFMGYEVGDYENNDLGDYIGTGTIGAEKHSKTIKRLLDFYNDEVWNTKDYINTIIYKKIYMREPFSFNECKIFPIDYFSPYNPAKEKLDIIESPNTFSIHWYNASWGMNRKGYAFITTKYIKNPIVLFFTRIKRTLGFIKKRIG